MKFGRSGTMVVVVVFCLLFSILLVVVFFCPFFTVFDHVMM